MSSSDRTVRATPWSLDEFTAPAPALTPAFGTVPVAPAMPVVSDEERIAQIEAEAYTQGFADGQAAARDALNAEVVATVNALQAALESVRAQEARWVANAEENIAALAVLVARHLIQREITGTDAVVPAMVQTALLQYPMDDEVTIRLHQDDLAVCRQALEQQGQAAGRALRWVADASIQRGGCLTEGRERVIDGRIDTALERAYRNLAGLQA